MNTIKDKILTINFFIIEIDFAIKFKTNIDFVIEFTIDFVIKIKINFKIEGCYIFVSYSSLKMEVLHSMYLIS